MTPLSTRLKVLTHSESSNCFSCKPQHKAQVYDSCASTKSNAARKGYVRSIVYHNEVGLRVPLRVGSNEQLAQATIDIAITQEACLTPKRLKIERASH